MKGKENMKNYQQIGTDIGLLVQTKNAAYGDSIGKSAEALTLLYPNGLRPEQYLDAILAARDFDKRSRIAQGGADDEDPRKDIAGYGLYGVAANRTAPPSPEPAKDPYAAECLEVRHMHLPLVTCAASVATIKLRLLDLVRHHAMRLNAEGRCAQCGNASNKLHSQDFTFMGAEQRGPYLFCGSFCIAVFNSTLVELFAAPFEDLHAKLQGKETATCPGSANVQIVARTSKAPAASVAPSTEERISPTDAKSSELKRSHSHESSSASTSAKELI